MTDQDSSTGPGRLVAISSAPVDGWVAKFVVDEGRQENYWQVAAWVIREYENGQTSVAGIAPRGADWDGRPADEQDGFVAYVLRP